MVAFCWAILIVSTYWLCSAISGANSHAPAIIIIVESIAGAIFLIVSNSKIMNKLSFVKRMLNQRNDDIKTLAAILSRTNAAMIIASPCGHVRWVNETFEDMTGLSNAQIKNHKFLEFMTGKKTSKTAIDHIFTNIKKGKAICQEISIYSQTGRRTWVQVNLNPVYSDSGELDRFIIIMNEINDLKKREKKLIHHVTHDQLTKIANRVMFNQELDLAVNDYNKAEINFGVLFIDLDGFKPINDTHGHEAGDQVLQIAAKRMKACVREADTAARMGGDEFTILLNDLQSPSDAVTTAYRVLHSLERPIQTTCGEVAISASIGIALSDQPNITADGILESADQAMYEAKRAGKRQAFIIRHTGNETAIKLATIPR